MRSTPGLSFTGFSRFCLYQDRGVTKEKLQFQFSLFEWFSFAQVRHRSLRTGSSSMRRAQRRTTDRTTFSDVPAQVDVGIRHHRSSSLAQLPERGSDKARGWLQTKGNAGGALFHILGRSRELLIWSTMLLLRNMGLKIHEIPNEVLSPVRQAISLPNLAFCLSWMLLSIGCAPSSSVPGGSTSVPVSSAGGANGGTTGTAKATCSGGTVVNIAEPSIYLVQAGHEPYSVFVFPQQSSGSTAPTAEIPGTLVSLDGAGDIYVLSPSGSCIVEYPAPSSAGTAARFLPVGPGSKISAVNDMAVTTTGQIYISDGTGIAVFDPTATGDADPTRYIVSAGITPGLIAVDSSDNLYVQNTVDSSVAVFGPTATGLAVPSRTITGQLTTGSHITFGMVTDSLGNLYVLCIWGLTDQVGTNMFGVLEFSPTADGNAAPIRQISSPDMYPWSGGPGLALDAAGVIYITAGPPIGGTQTVFEFPATVSGSVHPSNIVTSPGWTDTLVSHIAVH
jgi:sugar lactone lactonase YvrE